MPGASTPPLTLAPPPTTTSHYPQQYSAAAAVQSQSRSSGSTISTGLLLAMVCALAFMFLYMMYKLRKAESQLAAITKSLSAREDHDCLAWLDDPETVRRVSACMLQRQRDCSKDDSCCTYRGSRRPQQSTAAPPSASQASRQNSTGSSNMLPGMLGSVLDLCGFGSPLEALMTAGGMGSSGSGSGNGRGSASFVLMPDVTLMPGGTANFAIDPEPAEEIELEEVDLTAEEENDEEEPEHVAAQSAADVTITDIDQDVTEEPSVNTDTSSEQQVVPETAVPSEPDAASSVHESLKQETSSTSAASATKPRRRGAAAKPKAGKATSGS